MASTDRVTRAALAAQRINGLSMDEHLSAADLVADFRLAWAVDGLPVVQDLPPL